MRRKTMQNIGDVVRELLRTQHLDGKLNEIRLMEVWSEVLGQNLAKYTGDKFIKNKVLYVQITSAVLRSELFSSRSKLVSLLNERVGAEVIEEIRFQ